MDDQHPDPAHPTVPSGDPSHHADCPAGDGSMFCLCEALRKAERRVLGTLAGMPRLSAAHLEVDGDGATRVLYSNDSPHVLVAREMLDRVVTDFNMRSDWITPAEHRCAVEQAVQSMFHTGHEATLVDSRAYAQGRSDALASAVQQMEALGECACLTADAAGKAWVCDLHRYVAAIRQEQP